MTLSLSSSAFAPGTPIPNDFSCRGRNISPTLSWNGAPANTASFALILDDPDAPGGTYVHWVVYNIPSTSKGLPQAVAERATLADGTAQGRNSASHQYYDGPCPPFGTHRYFFKLFALDAKLLDLPSGATAS
ncbi:MAG TPA: YbhB/YbcL family Raf kinase inhibitor-like protein, partial [Bacteroidota bacterium]